MLCCALGLLALITGASARGLRALLGAWPVAIVAGGSATVLAVLVPQHVEHYRQRAQAHDRTALAEIVAAPLCSGAPRS
jgi:hypothetical protein